MNTTKSWKQSTKNSKAASSESAQEKALNLFAETMIEKIESIQQDWKKPKRIKKRNPPSVIRRGIACESE